MMFLLGAVIALTGLWMHHPVITLVGIGLMAMWLVNEDRKKA